MTNKHDPTAATVLEARRRAFGGLLALALAAALLLRPLPASLAAPDRDARSLRTSAQEPATPSGDSAALLAAGTLSLSPSSSVIDVGATVTVDVWIHDTADLYGMDFCILFDGTIVNVPSNDATLLWEVLDPAHRSVFSNSVSDADGVSCPCTGMPTDKCYHYLVFNLNPAEPFSGSGRFAQLTFQGLSPGTTALHFCYVMGSTRTGESLYPAWVDATITVGGSTIFGDLDGDCDVDIVDIMLVVNRWGALAGDARYDAHYDLDSDGDIDIADITMVAAHWNEHC